MDRKQLQIVAQKEEMERMKRQTAQLMEANFIERVMLAALTGATANFKNPKDAAQHAIDTANNFLALLNAPEQEETKSSLVTE